MLVYTPVRQLFSLRQQATSPVEVTIAAKGEPADEAMDAASILSLMSLGAKHGDVVVLRAEGEGAEEALDTLVKILETDHDAE